MIDLTAYFDDQIAKLQEAKAQYLANLEAKYSEGYADGKASIILPSEGTGEKLFTQEDMNKLAETAKAEKDAEYQPQINSLNEKVAALEAVVAGIDAKVADAVNAAKKEIAAKVKAAKADDDALIAELEQ